MLARTLALVAIAVFSVRNLEAQTIDCSTSCDDRCRISFLGGGVVEPSCKSACETQKSASCRANAPLPLPPVPAKPPVGPVTPRLPWTALMYETEFKSLMTSSSDTSLWYASGADARVQIWKRVQELSKKIDPLPQALSDSQAKSPTATITPDTPNRDSAAPGTSEPTLGGHPIKAEWDEAFRSLYISLLRLRIVAPQFVLEPIAQDELQLVIEALVRSKTSR